MALIWVGLSMMVLIGVVGLVLDTGYAVLVGQQLQHAADASALAGAQIVMSGPSGVKAAAVSIANQNNAAGSALQVQTSDVDIGTYSGGAFTVGGLAPNSVRVTPKRVTGAPGAAVPLFFGAIFGSPTMDMSRSATAMINSSDGPALVILDHSKSCSLDVKGNTSLTVLGGPIQVNSSAGGAACFTGTSGVSAEALDVTGGTNINGGATIDALINTGVSPLADPLAGVPEPTAGSPLGSVYVGPNTQQTISPGYYDGGITVQGTLYLQPGIYIIDGSGLSVNAQGTIAGLGGVMLFIAGNSSFDASANNVSINLMAPDPTRDLFLGADTYAGIVFFQARSDTQQAKLSLAGSISVDGTIYIPSGLLNITSGGGETGARVIVNQLRLGGGGNVLIDRRAGRATDGPPYLVQ
jgi:hypothetical protein